MDQQPEAVPSGKERQRRLGRAEHGDVPGGGCGPPQPARMALGLRPRRGADDDARQPPKRRQAGALALADLALVEGRRIASITG